MVETHDFVAKGPYVEALFVGGVGNEVTGSGTVLKITTSDGKVRYGMIDAGAVQGEAEWMNFVYPVRAENLDFVVLTHAHYDHVGALALLYKRGFKGKIYLSHFCKRLLKPMLYDGAKLNERNQVARNLSLAKFSDETESADDMSDSYSQLMEDCFAPLYTQLDVDAVLEMLCPLSVNTKHEIADGVKVRLMPTTHQIGSCRVELYVKDPTGETYNMVFSGDVGTNDSMLYKSGRKYTNYSIDALVLESLHGVRPRTETWQMSKARLKTIIEKGIKKKQTIVLAGFALDRNAMLVYMLNEIAKDLKKRKINLSVIVDSPLTSCYLDIYRSIYGTDTEWFKDLGQKPFDLPILPEVKGAHINEINRDEGPRVIITASATGFGGPVVNYFQKGIQDNRYVFVFCGWSSPDSPSSIIEQAKNDELVSIPIGNFKKKCLTFRLHGLSSHGYFDEIREVVSDYPNCNTLILNHANDEEKIGVCNAMSEFFNGDIAMPCHYDAYRLQKSGIEYLGLEEALQIFGDVIDSGKVLFGIEELNASEV